MSKWYVCRPDVDPIGPVTTETLIAGVKAGRLPQDSLVCAVGQDQWLPLAAVLPQLAQAGPKRKPSPAPVPVEAHARVEPPIRETNRRLLIGALGAVLALTGLVVLVGAVLLTRPWHRDAPTAAASGSTASTASTPSTAPSQQSSAALQDAAAPKDAAAPDAQPTPSTELQRLALLAKPVEEFEQLVDANAWAFYPPGTTGCKLFGKPENLTQPDDPALEFDREKIRSQLVGKLVVIRKDSEATRPDAEDYALLAPYDHAKRTFDIKLQPYPRWPVLGGSPVIADDPEMASVQRVFVADQGDGYVLTVPRRIPYYIERSKTRIPVAVDPEEAKKWTTDGVHIRYTVVQRFKHLGYHKNCIHVCKRVDRDTVDCPDDPPNQGIGPYFVTEPIGYEIYANGRLVAEKQPSDPPSSAKRPDTRGPDQEPGPTRPGEVCGTLTNPCRQ